MRSIFIAYGVSALVMGAFDFSWLNLTADPIYHRVLGAVLAEKANMPAAVAFYIVYLVGVSFFAIMPALENGDWSTAIVRGALFGFFAYATYDLTNLATLKVWSLKVSLIDMAWGTFVTAAAAGAGANAALFLEKWP